MKHWYDVLFIMAYIYYSIIELSVRHYGKGSLWANIDAAIEDELRR